MYDDNILFIFDNYVLFIRATLDLLVFVMIVDFKFQNCSHCNCY